LIRRGFIAPTVLAVAALGPLGCSDAGSTASTTSADESYSSVANGLWALDGTPGPGDIELLQLATRSYASIVREAAAAAAHAVDESVGADAPSDVAHAGAPPAAEARRAATGDVMRVEGASTPTLSIKVDDQTFTATETADTLTLTNADGRVLTYRRSYRLYCVPTDRGVEATMILELGKEPKLVGVNGDGRLFPKAGTHPATVHTDVLFRLHDYEISSAVGASSVTVKLPWSDMSKPEVSGTIAIVGAPDALPPTPISCERVPASTD